jgi:putative transposase
VGSAQRVGSDLAIQHRGGETLGCAPLGVMARPLRLLVENGHYHVTSRTWDRSPLYRSDEDRRAFLDLVEANVERFDWRCLAYCLMDNHFHLLLRTPLANLPRGMQRLNSSYAQKFNRWRDRKGPVYEDRYHGQLIQREPHLLEVHRYIAMNPVRAGKCRDPRTYAWSSHAAIAGIAPAPAFLAVSEAHDLFASSLGGEGRVRYLEFVEAAVETTVAAGPVIGDGEYVREAMRHVSRNPEIPRRDWTVGRPSLADLLRDGGSAEALALAYRNHGYTMSRMAEYLGCHVSTVSRQVAAYERAVLDCKI